MNSYTLPHSSIGMSTNPTPSLTTHIIPSSSTTQNLPSVSPTYLPSPSAPYPTYSTSLPLLGLPHWMLYIYVVVGVVGFLILLCFCLFLLACLLRLGRKHRLKQQLLPLYHMEQEYSDEEDELLMRDSEYSHRRMVESVTIQPILSFES